MLPVRFVVLSGYTGVQGLAGGSATLPKSNQKPLLVTDKVGRTPRLAWGEQIYAEYDTFAICALTLSIGRQQGHPASNKLGVEQDFCHEIVKTATTILKIQREI